jgi:glycine dehydrogenase subunit 1
MVAAATIYMALLGPAGLADVARACHTNTLELRKRLLAVRGVQRVFAAPVFHEFVLRLEKPVDAVLRALRAEGILAGLDLTGPQYPELGQALLVCATETKTTNDLERYASALASALT